MPGLDTLPQAAAEKLCDPSSSHARRPAWEKRANVLTWGTALARPTGSPPHTHSRGATAGLVRFFEWPGTLVGGGAWGKRRWAQRQPLVRQESGAQPPRGEVFTPPPAPTPRPGLAQPSNELRIISTVGHTMRQPSAGAPRGPDAATPPLARPANPASHGAVRAPREEHW